MGTPCPTNITTWEDDPLIKGTYIKKRHQDLEYLGTTAGIRQAIDRERLRRGLNSYNWTYTEFDTVHRVDIEDARSALDDIYNNPGDCTNYTSPACQNDYIDEPIEAGTPIKTEHIAEIRQRVNELEDDCLSYEISYNTAYDTGYDTNAYTTIFAYHFTYYCNALEGSELKGIYSSFENWEESDDTWPYSFDCLSDCAYYKNSIQDAASCLLHLASEKESIHENQTLPGWPQGTAYYYSVWRYEIV